MRWQKARSRGRGRGRIEVHMRKDRRISNMEVEQDEHVEVK
jgi:hypothetical protein